MAAHGVQRFLSRRDGKRNHGRDSHEHSGLLSKKQPPFASSPELMSKPFDPASAADFYGLFDAQGTSANQVEEQKIKTLRHRLLSSKGVILRNAQLLWALHSNAANGDVDAAYDLLHAMSDASEGIVTSYDPRVRLLGAQNRQGVTCFLDATLFSMFSRLDSFEAMLYNSFDDLPRNKLGFLLRVWVNLLRNGKLITTDITKVLQEALAECGWREAAELHQQDASEAFTFITGVLELPLLTLKMDIYHTGKEDTNDDHKFINERLLEVAIPPPEPTDEHKVITLEECLEDYFNNRIEVRRYMERRSTLSSIRKTSAVHVETVEIDPDSSSPSTPVVSPIGLPPERPVNRMRTPSIIQERYVPIRGESGSSSLVGIDSKDSVGRLRAGSVRKEVMMPAWQFFSLIPWYTDNAPTNDAQVAAHFSSKRPVLGLCLKRYTMTPEGRAIRLDTQIDIPVEIGVPHFIQDEHMEETGSLSGNFKLSLQSVVCHRGTSVDSGHYIALVRGTPPPNSSNSVSSTTPTATWMRFDDLAPSRITVVDIEKALREETPYLLFYQIVPIDGDPGHITSGEETVLSAASERNASVSEVSSVSVLSGNQNTSGRPSFEVSPADDDRGRSPVDSRRMSAISLSERPSEPVSETALNVPKDTEKHIRTERLSGSYARNNVTGLGRTLSKLAKRKSREVQLNAVEDEHRPEIHVTELSQPSLTDKSDQILNATHHEHNKGHRKEKSRSRLARSKIRGEKPDRECVVM
ncbi:hypothetical protein PV08_03933 [Exophiala spinifera]|uniref:ubiquitinyl hydrolase 1 n=1 Tax=Exophiala spinifera TaxID=91928 RepID=A0A0D2BZI3_9EURO|nr:uncharacterized protein PV08_03933 [Exophiala spinifera]KIW16744.1 hypothetical protein PV08_03933 [Exophiala spinifera]